MAVEHDEKLATVRYDVVLLLLLLRVVLII